MGSVWRNVVVGSGAEGAVNVESGTESGVAEAH